MSSCVTTISADTLSCSRCVPDHLVISAHLFDRIYPINLNRACNASVANRSKKNILYKTIAYWFKLIYVFHGRIYARGHLSLCMYKHTHTLQRKTTKYLQRPSNTPLIPRETTKETNHKGNKPLTLLVVPASQRPSSSPRWSRPWTRWRCWPFSKSSASTRTCTSLSSGNLFSMVSGARRGSSGGGGGFVFVNFIGVSFCTWSLLV